MEVYIVLEPGMSESGITGLQLLERSNLCQFINSSKDEAVETG